jgi:mono/diheme cytochrome c family protein
MRWIKRIAIALVVLVAAFATLVAVRVGRTFDAPYPELAATTDPKMIERGRYLIFGPAHCGMCHGDVARHEQAFAGEELPLSGGFTIAIPPGKFHALNITPDPETGIGKRTDGEIVRALRYGVGHDGRAVFPFMPFQHIADDDMVAILSYLRAQPPVKKAVPARELSVLGKVVVALLLEPEGPSREVRKSIVEGATAEYGEYLAKDVANCIGCHTDRDLKTGEFIGEPFAGGLEFPAEGVEGVTLVTPNLTPHPSGFMAGWTEQQFVDRIRAGTNVVGTPMPWGPFSRMKEDDLRAVWRFLQTVPPVDRTTGPTVVAEK